MYTEISQLEITQLVGVVDIVAAYYEVNGNGWIYGGQYGYCRGAMGHGRYMISGTDWVQAFDFKGMTSDFTLRFRYDHLVHDGTAYTGADHGLSGASSSTYHGAQPMDVHEYSRLAVRVMSILRPDGIQFGGGYGSSAGRQPPK